MRQKRRGGSLRADPKEDRRGRRMRGARKPGHAARRSGHPGQGRNRERRTSSRRGRHGRRRWCVSFTNRLLLSKNTIIPKYSFQNSCTPIFGARGGGAHYWLPSTRGTGVPAPEACAPASMPDGTDWAYGEAVGVACG